MKDSFILAPGQPHELLGLLRRLPGIEDINLLLDSDRLLKEFKKHYPDNKICGETMDEVCRLGLIAEMAGIINSPMWRKRSFINKCAIQLMKEGRIKEYQMCEFLESMMQLFDWEFEIQIMRRWETAEEDSVEYSRKHLRAIERSGSAEHIEKAERRKERRYMSDDVELDSEETDEPEEEAIYEPKPQRKREKTVQRRRMSTDSQSRSDRGGSRQSTSRPAYPDEDDSSRIARRSRMNAVRKKNRIVTVKYDYIDNNGMVTDIKGYIQNEIIKSGIRFEKIMSNAVKRDVRSAIKGNADAQYRMGSYYAEPDTKHTDYEEALKWYRVSASQGNKKAQFEIGMLYDGGKIKCTDYKKEAIKCYLALADAGFPTAQCKLGMKYRLGDGVKEDINEAIKWFKRAAIQGHTDAQRNLGDVYMAIHKTDEAMKWYERAAAAGDYFSAKQLGKKKL